MGLLAKALELLNQYTPFPELDEIGEIIKSRILRITPGADVPYTALGLLTNYGQFDAAVCLAHRNEVYESYASVGLHIEPITIHDTIIYKKEKNNYTFFKLYDHDKSHLNFMDPDMNIWCFPLDNYEPWKAVMLLGRHDFPAIDPRAMPVLLKEINKIISPHKKNTETENAKESNSAFPL